VNFENDGKKATQAVAHLIQKTGHPVDYLRLSKLIYLADCTFHLVTKGGQYAYMDGPK